jgi:hypothetical protein
MSDEKGGSIVFILIVLVCGILWSNQPSAPKADFTQPVDGLSEQVATVKDFVATTDDHETDFAMIDHVPDVTKMVDPSPSDKPKAKPEIIIFTSTGCPPCEKWKRCEAPKFESNGWKVAYCEDHPYPRTPTFLITENGRTVEKVGYFTFEELRKVLQ